MYLNLVRFESLTLSHNNMIALKPVLLAWLEEAEAARRDPVSFLSFKNDFEKVFWFAGKWDIYRLGDDH